MNELSGSDPSFRAGRERSPLSGAPTPMSMRRSGWRTGGLIAARRPLEVPVAYTEAFEKWRALLTPGELVPDDVPLGFLRSAPVHPGSFTLRPDRDGPTKDVAYPGKSATVVFSADPAIAVPVVLRRPATDRDRVFTTTADRLREAAGFVPFHAPAKDRPLHVQVVHEDHLADPTRPDIPEVAKRSLAQLLSREGTRRVL